MHLYVISYSFYSHACLSTSSMWYACCRRDPSTHFGEADDAMPHSQNATRRRSASPPGRRGGHSPTPAACQGGSTEARGTKAETDTRRKDVTDAGGCTPTTPVPDPVSLFQESTRHACRESAAAPPMLRSVTSMDFTPNSRAAPVGVGSTNVTASTTASNPKKAACVNRSMSAMELFSTKLSSSEDAVAAHNISDIHKPEAANRASQFGEAVRAKHGELVIDFSTSISNHDSSLQPATSSSPRRQGASGENSIEENGAEDANPAAGSQCLATRKSSGDRGEKDSMKRTIMAAQQHGRAPSTGHVAADTNGEKAAERTRQRAHQLMAPSANVLHADAGVLVRKNKKLASLLTSDKVSQPITGRGRPHRMFKSPLCMLNPGVLLRVTLFCTPTKLICYGTYRILF
jgi:hypothetical protein